MATLWDTIQLLNGHPKKVNNDNNGSEGLFEDTKRAVVRAVGEGAISKAVKIMLSTPVDPSINVIEALKDLYPSENAPDLKMVTQTPSLPLPGIDFSEADFNFPKRIF